MDFNEVPSVFSKVQDDVVLITSGEELLFLLDHFWSRFEKVPASHRLPIVRTDSLSACVSLRITYLSTNSDRHL
jgi:hypothetical protein